MRTGEGIGQNWNVVIVQRRFRTGRKDKYSGSMTRVIRSTRSVKLRVDVMKPSSVPLIIGADFTVIVVNPSPVLLHG